MIIGSWNKGRLFAVKSYRQNCLYFTALSILQNGKMPVFLSPELVEEIFDTTQIGSPAVKNLREGLNVLGLHDVSMHGFQYEVIMNWLLASLTGCKGEMYF